VKRINRKLAGWARTNAADKYRVARVIKKNPHKSAVAEADAIREAISNAARSNVSRCQQAGEKDTYEGGGKGEARSATRNATAVTAPDRPSGMNEAPIVSPGSRTRRPLGLIAVLRPPPGLQQS